MSKDLILKHTKRNWSREPAASNPEYAAQEQATAQSNQIARLAALKAKAESGDKKAQKKWAKINKKVAKLHLKAAKGNLKAATQLAALTPTGLFVTTVGPKVLKTTMHGTFVGKDEILGTFVGEGTVTRIRGNDNLTEIVTSGGEFVGNDKLTEIITSGWGFSSLTNLAKKAVSAPLNIATKAVTTPLKIATQAVKTTSDLSKAALKAGYKYNPITGKYNAINLTKMTPLTRKFPSPPTISGEEIITSGEFIGEEERALAAEGGACERAALNRRRNC